MTNDQKTNTLPPLESSGGKLEEKVNPPRRSGRAKKTAFSGDAQKRNQPRKNPPDSGDVDGVTKRKERDRQYYLANKERLKAAVTKRYLANAESIKKVRRERRRMNADEINKRKREKWKTNPESHNDLQRARRLADPELFNAKRRERYKANPDKVLAWQKAKRNSDPEGYNAKRRKRHGNNPENLNAPDRKRYSEDPLYALRKLIRNSTSAAFRKNGYKKTQKTASILGCTWEHLKRHIEKQFTKGMNWGNRHLWHIDHILPLASAKCPKDMKRLAHFTNLQPLWGVDNLAKGDKIVTCQPELTLSLI